MSRAEPTASLHALLAEARQLACDDHLTDARMVCAKIMFGHMSRLVREPELLRRTVVAIIYAHGFELLQRLLAAVDPRLARFAVDKALLRHPAPDDAIECWSAALVKGRTAS